MELPIALVVADKYRVVRMLGEGGMGVVVAADHLQLQSQVAIKFLKHSGPWRHRPARSNPASMPRAQQGSNTC